MMIEIFQGPGIIYLVVNVYSSGKQKVIIWTESSTEISKFYNFCADIRSSMFEQFFHNFDTQILQFNNLSLE